jgi:HAD superfamily hydrolase (TIGR01509 family)
MNLDQTVYKADLQSIELSDMRQKKLQVEGLLIDLDGTIVDSRPAYLEALRRAFMTIGQKTVDIEIVTEIPRRLEQNQPINTIMPDMDSEKFLDAYLKAYYDSTATKTKPLPNITETLRKLYGKAKLGLVTMRCVSKDKVKKELETFGISRYFETITTAFDRCLPKPSPEAFWKSAKSLGVDISKCAVVGDSVADIRAGKNAGAITIAVLSGIFTKEELEKENPDLILKNIIELPDFL